MSTGLMHFAFLQILLGALVAGIDAGRTFTDWPLMAGGHPAARPFQLSRSGATSSKMTGWCSSSTGSAGYLLLRLRHRRLAARSRRSAAPARARLQRMC
jgi:cytochrome c oxidase assembly protein subunit 15